MRMEKLKQKLDYLNEKQFQEVAALMTLLKQQAPKSPASEPLCRQREHYTKRTQGMKEWMLSLPLVSQERLASHVSEPSPPCV